MSIPKAKLGNSDLQVSRLLFGCMGMSNWNSNAPTARDEEYVTSSIVVI
jgi:aryl-alcohol dehydrogenase-like predicted oxidoreductase